MSRQVRQITNKLLEMVDDGVLDKDLLIRACLGYMSEADVADMAHCNAFLYEDFEEDDDEAYCLP